MLQSHQFGYLRFTPYLSFVLLDSEHSTFMLYGTLLKFNTLYSHNNNNKIKIKSNFYY